MADDLVGAKTGIQTVVAQCHDAGALPPDVIAGEQTALFPLSQSEADGEARKTEIQGRGPGRPPGAGNKSTTAWREFLLTKHRSPLQGLAEIADMPLLELAQMLGAGEVPGFDRLVEILKIKITCMKELAPYVHSKMPIAIDAGEKGLINLVINNSGLTHNPEGSHGFINAEFLKMEDEQNQLVSGDENQNSNGTHSNGDKQAADLDGENV